MGLHAVWQKCRCGCGCGHSCLNRYGPYFIISTAKTSKYIGRFGTAIAYLEGRGLSWGAAKELLLGSAVASAISMKKKGCSIAPPGSRVGHLAEVHGRGSAPRRAGLSPLEKEFWERVEKA